MENVKVKFIKYHPQWAHEVGDTPTVSVEAAQALIDGGYAVPLDSKGKEKAIADASALQAVTKQIPDSAAEASAKARSEAHAHDAEKVTASVDAVGTTQEVPVATEPDGTKVLAKPADEAKNQTSAPGKKVN